MPTYSHGPRLLKGAIVAIDSTTGQQKTIAFQYNPETVKRSLQPQMAGGDQGQQSQSVRYTGAPVETIDLEVVIDATDQLESGDANAVAHGIFSQLAQLELLTYPTSKQVIQNNVLLASGTLEIAPMVAPLTLFVWGPNRVIPVRVNTVSISEELFDPHLNPLRATVTLSLRALSYSDLDSTAPGYSQFLAYQQNKESLAQQATSNNPNTSGGIQGS